MNKKIIFLMIVLILISGCGKLLPKQKQQASAVGGTTALEFKFLNLPKQIVSGQTFNIMVDMENKGKADIEEGVLILSGYDDKYISLESSKKENIKLLGVSQYNVMGEKTIETFKITKTDIPLKEYRANFVAVACYKYKTEASVNACINPNLVTGGTVSVQEGCNEMDYKLGSQGAPVAVTKIETYYGSDFSFVQFRIFLEDKGKGRVRAEEAYSRECIGPALVPEDLGKIKIEAFLGGQSIECFRDGFQRTTDNFRLQAGKSEIECRASIDKNQPAYTSPLSIRLSYGYVQSINAQVKIVKT